MRYNDRVRKCIKMLLTIWDSPFKLKKRRYLNSTGAFCMLKIKVVIAMINSRNYRRFIDVCQGQFGRKVISTSVAEITKDNVVKVLNLALSTHWQNREEIDYLDKYYRGDQPILYRTKPVRPEINNKIVENHAYEIVEFMTGQNFSEPMQYVSNNKNKDVSISEQVDKLNKYMDYENAGFFNAEMGRWRSICGTSYKFVWNDKNANLNMDEAPFSIDVLDPRETFVIYSTGFGRRPKMSVQIIKTEDGKPMYCCYTDNKYFEIVSSQVTNGEGLSNVLRVPVIEYANNERRLSDIEIVITLTDMLNNMQSNRMDGIEQFVQAFMKFVNCDIDEDKFLTMCQLGAVKVKAPMGMRADVDMISSQLDQGQTQISKDDVYSNMLIINGMPSREQNTGGDTGQAVYLRNGWDFAAQRADIGETIIKKSEREFLKIVLKILNDTQATGISLKLSDIDIKITRSKTDNMLVKVQALVSMLSTGIDAKTAIKTSNLWSDSEKVYLLSMVGLEAKFQSSIAPKTTTTSTPSQNVNGGGPNV